MKNMWSKNKNKGFTLLEIIVAITIASLVATIAGSLVNFSFKAEKKVEAEYDLQADVRLASEVINNAVRNASVTFLINGKIPAGKASNWNYIGLTGDASQIVQYTWDEPSKKHQEKILLKAEADRTYSLEFENKAKSKLIDFTVGAKPNTGKSFEVKSSLNSMNSLAVDYIKDEKNPSAVIAYRLDERPKAGKDTKSSIAISMVLDNSGSMDKTLNNNKPDKKNPSRNSIMQKEANKLIDDFPENVHLLTFSYATNANSATGSSFIQLTTAANKDKAKEKIPKNPVGGTNTGDALRRAYFKLLGFEEKESLRYIILLTDGNPTYHSSTSKNDKNNKKNYRLTDGDVTEDDIGGEGNSDPYSYSLNYAKTLGALISSNKAISKTFVIGFSAVKSDIDKAKEIALSANKAGTKVEEVYFEAGSEEELGIAFDSIKEAMLTEYWHIYGPYGKPAE